MSKAINIDGNTIPFEDGKAIIYGNSNFKLVLPILNICCSIALCVLLLA